MDFNPFLDPGVFQGVQSQGFRTFRLGYPISKDMVCGQMLKNIKKC